MEGSGLDIGLSINIKLILLSIVLLTDPKSPWLEKGIYLFETVAGESNTLASSYTSYNSTEVKF